MEGDYKTRLDKEQTAMSKDIEHIKKDMAEVKEYIKEDREWKNDFTEKTNKKYATKREVKNIRAAIAGIIAVGLSITGGIIAFFYKIIV